MIFWSYCNTLILWGRSAFQGECCLLYASWMIRNIFHEWKFVRITLHTQCIKIYMNYFLLQTEWVYPIQTNRKFQFSDTSCIMLYSAIHWKIIFFNQSVQICWHKRLNYAMYIMFLPNYLLSAVVFLY